VDRSILDKEVSVGPNAHIGDGTDLSIANRQEPSRLNTGITVIGKRALIPRGVRIGRNVRIAEGVRAVDFRSRVIRSGGSVDRRAGVAELGEVAVRKVGTASPRVSR
ncbi:MAG TPA: hypothetical protein VIF44_06435, partial [Candidatus Limnocylindrales bacterium]